MCVCVCDTTETLRHDYANKTINTHSRSHIYKSYSRGHICTP